MPVELKGSYHCGSVTFTVQSSTPVPYMPCGSINLGAHAETLRITKGRENISYVRVIAAFIHARSGIAADGSHAKSERHFCSKCSAMLWLWDETLCAPTSTHICTSFDMMAWSFDLA
ncbi:hypothetical protein F5148DRAFT_1264186 [Russula earlei]|uniref:Uncharacterized protein n=1 Tax=Russula earlei TaxID=71964 RepID=A0ACC0TSM6_9AGAM|nr:hypothetical protein F5148DRAFT_1264186 [Russula earlei]